jgi:hypothetical protein
MCNSNGVIDDGCIALLIDELATFFYALHGETNFLSLCRCSTTAMVVINAHCGLNTPAGVSQTINFCFHHPAVV